MKSGTKAVVIACVVGVIAMVVVGITNVPKVSQDCLDLREKMGQLVINENSLAGALTPVQQESTDEALAERYGSLTDAQCKERSAPLSAQMEALAHTPWAPKMGRVGEQVREAMRECREKRQSGDLKTHADSAQCSNDKITAAFKAIQYPYMDLVGQFTQERLTLAQQLDKSGEENEDESDYARLGLELEEKEAARVKK